MKKLNLLLLFFIAFSIMPKRVNADAVMPSYTISAVQTNQHFEDNTPNIKNDMGELVYGMVGLVVNDEFQRDVVITVPKFDRPAGVSKNIIAGEQFKVDDILRVMMVGSSDEASLILANLVGGEKKLAILMNDKARKLGMNNTNFGIVTSKKDINTYSTPSDMEKLYKQVYNTPRIYDMMTEKKFILAETTKSKQRVYRTNNYLMDNYLYTSYYNENVIAGRTGYISGGACNIVAFAKIDGVRVILVSMGSQKSTSLLPNLEFAKNKINTMEKTYKSENIFKAGEMLKDFSVKKGKGASRVWAVTPSGVNILIAKGSTFTFDKQITPVQDSFVAPIEKGQKLATLTVMSKNQAVLSMDLVAEKEIKVSIISEILSSIWVKTLLALIILWLYWKIVIQIPRKRRREEIMKRRKESQEWLEANKDLY